MKTSATARFPAPQVMVAGFLGLMLLAGCGKEPKGQVVAIVDGQDISTQDFTAEVQDLPIPDSIDRMTLRNTVLQGLIDRKLAVDEARKQGLDKTPDFLALKKRNEEELLAGLLGHKVAQTVPLPSEHDVQNYIATHPLQFARRQRLLFDQVAFAPPKDRRVLAVLANAHSLAAAEAALRSIGVAPVRGQAVIDTGLTETQLAEQLDRAPAGEPILLPQGDRLVAAVITGREPIERPVNIAKFAAAQVIRAADLLHESEAQIAALRSTAEIQYSPGYEPEAPAAKTMKR